MKTLKQFLCLVFCFVLTSVIAIRTQGKWMNINIGDNEKKQEQITKGDTIQYHPDGTDIINTTFLTQDVKGYAGNVPLEISIKTNTIIDIKILPNNETPDFLSAAATLLEKWKGMSVDDALTTKVDAVSGATYSSNAIMST